MDLISEKLLNLGWGSEFKKMLKKNHVHYKEDNNSDLVILFNNYNDLFSSRLHKLMRSVVISKDEKRIVSYSCASPYENDDGLNHLLRYDFKKGNITECYEGTFMSLFNYNNKWYLSTRKCLDARESKYQEESYFKMFEDVLKLSNYKSFDEFTQNLDTKLNYYFILLDYRNINIVDYSYLYGEKYQKLVFTYVRDKDQNILTLPDYSNCPDFIDENIIKPKVIEEMEYLDNYNSLNRWSLPAKSEGIVLRFQDETLIKLQSLDYQFGKAIGLDENIYLGMMKMYQLDKLEEYINANKEKCLKITNPLNTTESFLTIGIINSVYRVLTSELLNLFNLLYNKEGNPVNSDLYQMLSKEYKYFMYKIRGLFYKKLDSGKDLSEKDIYYFLKHVDIEKIYELLRMRKLMNNLVFHKKFNDNVKEFKKVSNNITKINLKLVNIYTTKLFPEIMDNELPEVNLE